MIDKDLINGWVSKGIITPEQATLIQQELSASQKERSSNNIITSIATIGSIALGIGVILFIASNWQVISSAIKVILLCIGTFGSLWLGYLLAYIQKTYIRVGTALILLSALFYAATIFLIAQIYHINAHNHWLILYCLIGFTPLVYALKQTLFADLWVLTFYIWLGFVAFRSLTLSDAGQSLLALPVLVLNASVLLFYLGGFHFLKPELVSTGRTFRLTAINISMLMLLILTFGFFSNDLSEHVYDNTVRQAFTQITTVTSLLAVPAFLLSLAYLRLNPTRSTTVGLETGLTIAMVLSGITFLLLPGTGPLLTVIFNLLYISIALAILVIGYKREDMRLINTGVGITSIYIIVRYFDWFWELFDRSIFFILGGLLLVGGGLFLERHRRRLKQQFQNTNSS